MTSLSPTKIIVAVLIGLLSVILPILSVWYGRTERYSNVISSSSEYESYDFIIVGAGTAGSVLATRLSEASFRVLLIELGAHDNWLTHIPLAAPLLHFTSLTKTYLTEPQKHAAWGLVDKRSKWPVGTTTGGSGSINFLQFMRGTSSDYDRWQEMGCDGWNYRQVKDYFKKAETVHPQELLTSDLRGTEGPIPVTKSPCGEVCRAWLQTAKSAQYPLGDLNADNEYGFMIAQNNIYSGRRFSTATSYLWPTMDLGKLHLMLKTYVTKVIFNETKATGVEFIREFGETGKIEATHEVILAAGTIGTPHLLMNSGIGNPEHLKSLGIEPIISLPVGEGLIDHLAVPLYFHLEAPVSITMDKVKTLNNFWEYTLYGIGPLAQSGVEMVARLPLSANASSSDILLLLFNIGSILEEIYATSANIEKETFQAMFPDQHSSKEGFIMMVTLLHPHSVGHIRLKSNDTMAPPAIEPNYLSDVRDVHKIIEGIRLVAQLGQSEPLKQLGVELSLPRLPNCKPLEPSLDNDDYMECLVRTTALTMYHPLGTCRMGAESDPNTVVDSKLRLKHVTNVRIVDGSVMPTQISGTPNAAVIMIAEKAASIIEDHWKGKTASSKAPQDVLVGSVISK